VIAPQCFLRFPTPCGGQETGWCRFPSWERGLALENPDRGGMRQANRAMAAAVPGWGSKPAALATELAEISALRLISFARVSAVFDSPNLARLVAVLAAWRPSACLLTCCIFVSMFWCELLFCMSSFFFFFFFSLCLYVCGLVAFVLWSWFGLSLSLSSFSVLLVFYLSKIWLASFISSILSFVCVVCLISFL